MLWLTWFTGSRWWSWAFPNMSKPLLWVWFFFWARGVKPFRSHKPLLLVLTATFRAGNIKGVDLPSAPLRCEMLISTFLEQVNFCGHALTQTTHWISAWFVHFLLLLQLFCISGRCWGRFGCKRRDEWMGIHHLHLSLACYMLWQVQKWHSSLPKAAIVSACWLKNKTPVVIFKWIGLFCVFSSKLHSLLWCGYSLWKCTRFHSSWTIE